MSARASSTLYAVPGQRRRAASSASGESSAHGIGATPASASRTLVGEARGGDADERERPALPVHRLQVDARLRLRDVELEDQLARLERRHAAVVLGRQPVELGDRELARSSCAASRRARAAPPPTSDGCADAQSSLPKIACSRCSPSRAWQRVAAVQAARELEPPVPAARRLQQVAADRAHRRGAAGDAASRQASRSASGIAGSASSSASVVPAPIRVPSTPRGTTSADVDERLGLRASPSRSSGTTSVPPASATEPLPSAAAAASTARRPQELQRSPSRALAPRAARAASPRGVIGSERTSAPVASRIAFAIAAAVGTIGGSPSPFEPRFVRCSSGMSTSSVTISGHVGDRRQLVGVERLRQHRAARRVDAAAPRRACARCPG